MMLPESKDCHTPCYWECPAAQVQCPMSMPIRWRWGRVLDGLWPKVQGTRKSQEREGEKQSKTKLALQSSYSSITHCHLVLKRAGRSQKEPPPLWALFSRRTDCSRVCGTKEQWKIGAVFLGKSSSFANYDTRQGWCPFTGFCHLHVTFGTRAWRIRKKKKSNQTGSCCCCWAAH